MSATNAMSPAARGAGSTQPTIELVDVSLRFPANPYRDAPVLDRVNLSFFSGQVTAITGESGAGKTVLLKLIAGKLVPTQGAILLQPPSHQILEDGEAPVYLALPGRSLIDPVRSLDENLDRALFVDREFAVTLLDALSLACYAGKPIETWPQTARYHADLVWAFSQTAPVLLIDEIPGLDLSTLSLLSGLIQEHATQTGQCVIIACRPPLVAMRIGQQIVFLERGHVALDQSFPHREPSTHAAQYTIVIDGELDPSRALWFGAIHCHAQDNLTVMVVAPKDQAGLFGILTRIRDLGLEIEAIQRNSPA